jgi:type I restriction enzyme S subunit
MSFDLPPLPDNWEYRPLEKCALHKSISYGVVQPGQALMQGVPLIRVNNFQNGRIDLADLMKIAPDIEAKHSRTRLKGGEVLMTLVGSVGQVAIAQKDVATFNVARAVAVVCPNPDVGAQWIALCLRSPLSQHLLTSRANTTVQTTINLKDLKALPIPIPPMAERVKIVDVMYAIDDRIALLRETNATLEAIAQALFKSWFVDFDPVRAKQAGREPEGMDAETAALFPDGFEESELKIVPKGWKCSSIGEAFMLTMGQSPPGETYNEGGDGLPFYQGRTDFGFRFPTQRIFCNAPTRIADMGDTLVSVRAPVGDVNMALVRCCVGRGVAGVRDVEGHTSFVFYSMQALHARFQSYNGEGTVFGSINKKDFQALPLVLPSKAVLHRFTEIAGPIDDRIRESEMQMRVLTELRDSLLPRLISGQLRLPEAGEQFNIALTGT